MYWATVWAEDASGNAIAELPVYGIGAKFDPATTDDFITDMPLEMVTFNGTETTSAQAKSLP
jgi:hypothetical protein